MKNQSKTTNGETKYLTMRALGRPRNLSSHKVGVVLKENGLRLDNGNPTMKAINSGYAKAYNLNCGLTAYRWREDVVDDLLERHLDESK